MKAKFIYIILLFSFLGLISACKNRIKEPPIHGDVPPLAPLAPPENSGIYEFSAGSCLEGNEIRAGGKILEDGKPPANCAIHFYATADAQPIVIAKDLTFNADGSFKFKGKLPNGVPLNFREKGGDIKIAYGNGGEISISGGNCDGKEYEETLFDHSVFDKKNTTDIEIVFDEKQNMMWGNIKIKDAEDFRKILTAELQKRKKEGTEMPGLGTSGFLSDENNKLFEVFDEVRASVYGHWYEREEEPKANPKLDKSVQKPIIIQFGKGKSDATSTQTIAPSSSIDFIMNAKKGQTMSFTVGYDFKDSDIEAFLTEPGLQDISLTTGPKKTNEFKVNTSGNHRLTVHNNSNKKITMTLYLDIK